VVVHLSASLSVQGVGWFSHNLLPLLRGVDKSSAISKRKSDGGIIVSIIAN